MNPLNLPVFAWNKIRADALAELLALDVFRKFILRWHQHAKV